MTRPYVAHELFQYGSAQSASLLDAFDTRFAEGDMDPRAIAPIARLMGAGDVVDRSDLQYERYRTARPVPMWDLLTHTPGLATPVAFGPPTPNIAGPKQPMVDEVALGTDPTLPNPPPVASFAVDHPADIVRTHPATGSLLMAGDADGLVDAAPLGLLDGPQADFFSASYATDPTGFARSTTTTPPGGDRHQPQAGRALGDDPRADRLHRAGRRGGALRPHRPAPGGLPRPDLGRPDGDRAAGRGHRSPPATTATR